MTIHGKMNMKRAHPIPSRPSIRLATSKTVYMIVTGRAISKPNAIRGPREALLPGRGGGA
jgi:hypothetical protein